MPLWPNFLSGAYRARSKATAASTCKNLYLETTTDDADAKKQTLIGTPGRDPFFDAAPLAGCRGSFSQDDVTLSVVGSGVYAVDTLARSAALIGTVPDDGKPVAFSCNAVAGGGLPGGGGQVAIVAAGQLFIYTIPIVSETSSGTVVTGGTITGPIVTPNLNPLVNVDYIDGRFLANERDTIRVWYSDVGDGLTWDLINGFSREQTSDNIVTIKSIHNRLVVLGSQTGDVYYDTGDPDVPFQPFPGSVFQEGISSPWAIGILGEYLIWLSQDNQGKFRVVIGSDNQVPTRVSNPALEYALKREQASLPTAEMLCYEDETHAFACLTFSVDTTWCFDLTERQWHQRTTWNEDGSESRWGARGCISTPGGLLVGDYLSGVLSLLDLDTYTDNGADIRRERQAPYPSNDNQWVFLDAVEMGIEPGVGTIDLPDPAWRMEISYDGAQTFFDAGPCSIGGPGEFGDDVRAIWTMLGRVRQDRLVLRFSMTDAVKAILTPGLWLRFGASTGNL